MPRAMFHICGRFECGPSPTFRFPILIDQPSLHDMDCREGFLLVGLLGYNSGEPSLLGRVAIGGQSFIDFAKSTTRISKF